MMIMTRKAGDFYGMDWPRDVAYKETDVRGELKTITWAEVLDLRRQRQRGQMDDIRRVPTPRIVPCYVWTFRVPGWLYGGWWAYVVTLRKSIAVNFRHFDLKLAMSIMESVPLGILPLEANFEAWMKELARRHPRKQMRDRRKAGSIVGWIDDGETFTVEKPRPMGMKRRNNP